MITFTCKQCGKVDSRPTGWSNNKPQFCSRKCANKAHEILQQSPFKERREDIINLFNEGLTMQQIGDIHSITRERVRQILKRAKQQGFKVKKIVTFNKLPCRDCDRELPIVKLGRCGRCNAHFKDPTLKYFRPKVETECIRCKISFEKTRHGGRGLCNKCYRWYRYQLYPEQRKKQSEATMKWYTNKMTDPEYRKKRNDYFKQYSKNKHLQK